MLVHIGGAVFFQFPVRYPTFLADGKEPFVAQPPGSPAMAGIVNDKALITVGGNFRHITPDFHGFNAMESAAAGGPQFNFFYQFEKVNIFAVKTLFLLLFWFRIIGFYIGLSGHIVVNSNLEKS